MLHKESSSSREWRGRYFRLLDWSLVYYEGNSWSEVAGEGRGGGEGRKDK